MPLSTIQNVFQLYHGGIEGELKSTDLTQVTDELYSL